MHFKLNISVCLFVVMSCRIFFCTHSQWR